MDSPDTVRTAERLDRIDGAVERLLSLRGDLVVAAPLGLGKPHRLLNALYRRIASDSSRRLRILTALSLTPPSPSSELERRFLEPFLERHFGSDFPTLDYALAMRRDALPHNVAVEEFYLQSGALLGSMQAQSDYASLNYTHVARAVARRGVNALVQLVASSPDGRRVSLSCNPDLTLDLLDEIASRGLPRPLLVAEVHPDLPYIGGGAEVPADLFDVVLQVPGPAPKLFALPRQPVRDAEYAIGLYASTLVRDGGSLQIGIGALSDALTHALVLRHTRNDEYRAVLRALWPEVESSPLVREVGGLTPFEHGLYGASEMLMDGFAHLVDAGIVKRCVVDDVDVMTRLLEGVATDEDVERLERDGQFLHGAFFLGSHDFYRWLRELPPERAKRIGMTRVSHINQLYGGNETLERLQRRDSRFFNTCMLMTALGAAASDALEDGRVVSGVGGQYNFVAMAHALDDARSVLLFRATHGGGKSVSSNVRWSYGHTTIPRHLRDIAIDEYGIADLRGATDRDCVRAMLAICDARFADDLAEQAGRARKLAADDRAADAARGNTPDALRERLAPFRRSGLLPDFPLGSDFTPVERRLLRALAWLRNTTNGATATTHTLLSSLTIGTADREALERMGLHAPRGLRERLYSRLVRLALERTARSADR